MDDTNRTTFARLIAGIAATFRQEASEPLLEAYWLDEDPDEDFDA